MGPVVNHRQIEQWHKGFVLQMSAVQAALEQCLAFKADAERVVSEMRDRLRGGHATPEGIQAATQELRAKLAGYNGYLNDQVRKALALHDEAKNFGIDGPWLEPLRKKIAALLPPDGGPLR
jgi:hypothetical protein